MKCTNSVRKRKIVPIVLAAAVFLTGCGSAKYDMAYELNNDVSGFQLLNITNQETLEPFAVDLCVADKDVKMTGIDLPEAGAVALFNLKTLDTLYAKNVNVQINPASLTKVMTALVAIKYGSPDQMLTASENVLITERTEARRSNDAGAGFVYPAHLFRQRRCSHDRGRHFGIRGRVRGGDESGSQGIGGHELQFYQSERPDG